MGPANQPRTLSRFDQCDSWMRSASSRISWKRHRAPEKFKLTWLHDRGCDASSVRADTEVSIGRTNSKRALGFIVTRWKKGGPAAGPAAEMEFVLDKDQVAQLASYLTKQQARLLKPR